MNLTFINSLTLLSCISLIGLVLYTLINTKLTDKEKKKIYYSEIVISFFASISVLFFMIYYTIGMSSYISLRQFRENPHYFNNLKSFIWGIFCIITSPFSLTTFQYIFQENLGNSDKFLSIGILVSTIFSTILTLSVIFPSFNKLF